MAESGDVTTAMVTASGGRALEVLVTGPADGLPMIFHHGTPGGIARYRPMVEAAAARGLRTVLYARPGYGASTSLAGRTVADAAADVAAILAHLRARQFVTVGWSGGGPHALACARLLPGRCLAAASLSGLAPYSASGLDWLAGMSADAASHFTAAQAGEEDLTEFLKPRWAQCREISTSQLGEAVGRLASAADRHSLRGEFAGYLAASIRAGLRDGLDGWRDDDLEFLRDWGFSFGAPAAPVSVWHGDHDTLVPLAHGEWLARHIPATRAHLLIGCGHLRLPFEAVFDDLLELAGGR